MNYNDYQLPNNQSTILMRSKFDENEESQIRDLEDIYEKMLEQKSTLEENNRDGSLNSALEIANRSIENLRQILRKHNTSNKAKTARYSHFQPTKTLQTDETVHGKIPSSAEIDRHSNSSHQTPSNLPNGEANSPVLDTPRERESANGNTPTDTNNDVVSPPNNSVPSRNSRRGLPMQESFLSTLAKSLFVKKKKPSTIITADSYRNRFHNIITQEHSNCDPRRKIITGQVDLIRLLLLYLALRPHCRFCSRISQIASLQFDILMQVI